MRNVCVIFAKRVDFEILRIFIVYANKNYTTAYFFTQIIWAEGIMVRTMLLLDGNAEIFRSFVNLLPNSFVNLLANFVARPCATEKQLTAISDIRTCNP